MMWLATIRPGMSKPIVTKVIGDEIVFDAWGNEQCRPRQAYARPTRDGGATAMSQSPEGAIASAQSVLEAISLRREQRTKKDRA